MASGSDFFLLPATPTELCFDKDEFMKSSFLVDDFLQNYRHAGTLETIRDDLGIYLKILRSSMIELINEDYVDFVNLSANLIDLDQSIDAIKNPLTLLKDEILLIKQSLADSMQEISTCLEEKKQLRQLKKSLKNLDIVKKSLEKLNNLLVQINSHQGSDHTKAILFERAALEMIQLQFNMKYCEQFLNPDEKEKLLQLDHELLEKINEHFLYTLSNNDNCESLEKCLRVYCTLDKCSLAEKILKEKVINSYMSTVISEKNLQNSPHGITAIYNQILDFVSLKMKNLLALTHKSGKVKGFNFLLNSFWCSIEERLETNLASIFAPGNPETFYQKYKCTREFLQRIEMIIDDKAMVEQFHRHKQYKSFLMRWNLPVYFQIRFQEIATSLEQVCVFQEKSLLLDEANSESNQLQLVVFFQTINCIAKCWTDGIYLEQIFQKFFKLSLQLVARLITWLKEVQSAKIDFQKLDKSTFYAIVYRDIELFMLKIPNIKVLIMQKVKESEQLKDQITPEIIDSCFESNQRALEENLKLLEVKIVNEILSNCAGTLRSVQDIPRLFRKTNRDVPNKHLTYVEQLIQPINQFHLKYSKNFNKEAMLKVLGSVFNQLTVQYYKSVDEVLTSVQKTEESLRRLKNLREKSAQQANQPLSTTGQPMSDDDKIRLQLQLDILFYLSQIEGHQLVRSDVEKLDQLVQLIADFTKIKVELS